MADPRVVGALVIGALLGAGGLFVAERHLLPAPADCGGICGPGTTCEDGSCVPEFLEAPEESDTAVAPEDDAGARKGKRRRKRGGASGSADDAALAAGSGPPIDDDSNVPRFNANADQTISMSDGTGRLSDSQIDRELAKLDGAFQRCIRDGAARVAGLGTELGTGTVKYDFGIDGSGKVTGVNVRAPTSLGDAGIVPCVRKAVYGHRFPAFDGPTMKVSSSFSVD